MCYLQLLSFKEFQIPADFQIYTLHSRVSADTELSAFERWIVKAYRIIKSAEPSGL